MRYIVASLIIGICSYGLAKNPDVTTFVILPDTQTYLEKCPEVFDSQIDWILDNRDSIDMVLQVGDITQSNSPVEWQYMRKEFSRLDSAAVPYAVAWGNHDIGSRPNQFSDVHDTSMANRYFKVSEKKERDYWGGTADGNTLDNYYVTFKSGGIDWLVLNLEFGPSDQALSWADAVIAANPQRKIVLNTHAYLYSDSTLHDGNDYWLPENYGIGKEPGRTVNNGAKIWEKLLSHHENVIAVFCGHVLNSGVGTLVSDGQHGNKVYQMLANFQRGVENDRHVGEGYLRVVKFDHRNKNIVVETLSAVSGEPMEDERHNFIFSDVDI